MVCGTNTSYLEDSVWIGDKTPLTLCDVRVSPSNTVKPNLGAVELSEALSRVLPFTAKEDNRPVLQCVLFRAKEGKLTLVSADGFRLAVVKLDFDGDEGEALINRDDLRGITNALKRARRVKVAFEKSGDTLEGVSLTIDTEAIRYRWQAVNGSFPDYEKLIPADFKTFVSFDANEAVKAVSSLKVLYNSKSYPVDLTIGNGKLTMSIPDDKGQAELTANTQGEDNRVRLDGSYLTEALRSCGGMVELRLVNGMSPMLFTVDGYELVTMPMAIHSEPVEATRGEPVESTAESHQPKDETQTTKSKAVEEAEAIAEAKAETVTGEPMPNEIDEAVTEAIEIAEEAGIITKAEETTEPTEKPKRKRKVKEPVAVG